VENDFALVRKENKDKGKNSQGKEGKRKYLSNIKCFHCHEFGHYATKCPQNKSSKKDSVVAAAGEDLASQFELDFTLIKCMARTVMGIMWYLDRGASFHMMRNRDLLVTWKRKTSSRT